MWKNIVEWGRPQMTIWRMLIACWITMTTDTNPEYVIFIAFPQQQYLHDSASMLRYTYIAYLVWDKCHCVLSDKYKTHKCTECG